MRPEANHQARHSTPALPTIPRRVLVAALLRSFLSVLVVVTIYFLIPLGHLSEARSVAGFVLGVLLVVIVLAIQLRAIVRSPYPLVRTVEALATTGPLFVIVFATTQFAIGSSQPGSYSQPMTRLDALYFTVTTFTTVGYGDIAPVSQAARLVALLQMVLGLILLGIIARVITGAAKLGMEQHRNDHATAEESSQVGDGVPGRTTGP
jgi:voltage-gated potassium channel